VRVFIGLLLAGSALFLSQKASAAVMLVDLKTASSFAVLAGSGVTNAGVTTITGDVGSSPTGSTAGFGTVILNGTNHHSDAVSVDAKFDLGAAYDDAVGRTPGTIYGAIFDLGGLTLTSGVYNNPSSFGITGTLVLDARGDINAVWIFQAGSTLSTSANSAVVLVGGAQAANVFWQVGSSATIGANTEFVGSLLSFTSITTGAGSSVDGRLMALNGAVTLDNNSIIVPNPSVVVPEPSTLLMLGAGLAVLSILRARLLSRKKG